MSPYLKEELLRCNNQIGQPYPCSNQVVCRGIVYSSLDKLDAFIKSKNGYRNSRLMGTCMIDGERWRAIPAKESSRGCRLYKAYIDEDIDDDFTQNILLHITDNYCCFVEFF